jgi:hypothetical protein
MWQDPIVEEIHQYREAHAKKFNYDLWAMYEDLKIREKQSELEGWRLVSCSAADTEEKEDSLMNVSQPA